MGRSGDGSESESGHFHLLLSFCLSFLQFRILQESEMEIDMRIWREIGGRYEEIGGYGRDGDRREIEGDGGD